MGAVILAVVFRAMRRGFGLATAVAVGPCSGVAALATRARGERTGDRNHGDRRGGSVAGHPDRVAGLADGQLGRSARCWPTRCRLTMMRIHRRRFAHCRNSPLAYRQPPGTSSTTPAWRNRFAGMLPFHSPARRYRDRQRPSARRNRRLSLVASQVTRGGDHSAARSSSIASNGAARTGVSAWWIRTSRQRLDLASRAYTSRRLSIGSSSQTWRTPCSA